MNRDSRNEYLRRCISGFFVCLAVMSTTACANQTESPAVAEKIEPSAFESKLVTVNGVTSVENPRILVKFEAATPGGPLCPTGTAFKIIDNGRELIFPTGVPTNAMPITGRRNNISWVAADGAYKELENLVDFRFEVYFHPFKNSDRRDYRSRNVNENGKNINRAGPLEMRARRLLPEDVSFKYTIVRIEEVDINGQRRWAIMDDCKPLDPLIRVY